MAENGSSGNSKLKTWMFNPFYYLAGGKALGLGFVIIILTGIVGYSGQVHLDGVLDLHLGSTTKSPFWFFLAEGIIDWLSLALLLLLAGLILSKSRVRVLDIVGTQALARWPMLIAVLVGLVPAFQNFSRYLLARSIPGQAPVEIGTAAMVAGVACTITTIILVVCMVVLMFRGYAVSCNLKGVKAVFSFIVVLLLAEAASKIALLQLASSLTNLNQQ